MPNLHVPINLKAVETAANRVTMAWEHPSPPLAGNFTYRVYVNPSATAPLPGPFVTETPRPNHVISGFTTNVYIAVSSFDRTTGEESLQSAPVLVSIDHTASGMGGAVAKSDTDVPKYLRVNEDGSLAVTAAVDTTGLATEAKQDDQIVLLTGLQRTPFNEFWDAPVVPPLIPTVVMTFTVPAGQSYYLQGLYLYGRINCTIELRHDGVLRWRGGTDVLRNDLNASFQDGAIVADPGDELEVRVLHMHSTSLEFSGNIFGYKR